LRFALRPVVVLVLRFAMNTTFRASLAGFCLLGAFAGFAQEKAKDSVPPPEPRVVMPGPPPSDAIVLFDGKDLSQWKSDKGGPAEWEVKDGVATVNGTGSISTKAAFADCQLHVEWAPPKVIKGEGQGRGNSGVYLQSRYELQVLDSYQNKTYSDGQAGAIYKQYPPLVNASRPPGEWQTYDIIFHAPRFDENGKLVSPATMTALHNGVLIQDNAEIKGPTPPPGTPEYKAHPLKQPLLLQDHKNPVRYRSIWIREL
jgi:hypothetical protein